MSTQDTQKEDTRVGDDSGGRMFPYPEWRLGAPDAGADAPDDPTRRKRRLIALGGIGLIAFFLAAMPLVFSFDWVGRFRPPSGGGPSVSVAHILDMTGDLGRAEALLRDVVRRRPESHEGISAKLFLTRARARRVPARKCVKDVRTELLNPLRARGHNRRWFRLGVCLELLGDYPGAMQAFDKSLASEKGGTPVAHVRRALLRERLGDRAGAERDLKRALALNPHYPSALVHTTLFMLREGRKSEWRKYSEQLRSLRPAYHKTLENVYRGTVRIPRITAGGAKR